jgi:hypothetical protein
MGLGSLVDNEKNSSSSSGGNGSGSSKSSSGSRNREPTKSELQETHHKVVGSPPNRKAFKKEKWEEVTEVIEEHFDLSVNEILNSPPDKRHEKLHEAATWNEEEEEEKGDDPTTADVCYATGMKIDGDPVVIAGHPFDPRANAMQIGKALQHHDGCEYPYA